MSNANSPRILVETNHARETKTIMKHFLSVLAISLLIASFAHAADVGVSVQVGQPGFYGRLDIGGFPRPEFIYPEPILIQPHPDPGGEPLYLHVPPGHEKKWSKHCQKYHACGRPVYFVRDRWYNEVYVPHYREARGDTQGKRRGGKDKGGKFDKKEKTKGPKDAKGHKGHKNNGKGHDRG